jgi:Tol biopolymer transport system component
MHETRIEKAALVSTGFGSLLAAFGGLISLLLALSSPMVVRPAFGQFNSAAVRLEAGVAKEDVDGDLKSAMEIYQKIAGDASVPRDVRSKALLRLAGCYEKLGRQARPVYEQILHDYADQPAAVQARSRLALLKQQEHPTPPATMTVRKIENIKVANFGHMDADDTDGVRGVYFDSDNNVVLSDLAGHSKQVIFKHASDDGLHFERRSRDFSMLALLFFAEGNNPARLAVIKSDGTSYRELIRDDPEGSILGSHDSWGASLGINWSWDNHYLVVTSWPAKKEGGRLFLVSVADGTRRELLSIKSGYFSNAVFSPDGHFIAYEVAPLPDRADTSYIFVLPVQGGEPRQIYESAPRPIQLPRGFGNWTLLDWTADGRYLAIADAPKGKTGLYLLPIKDGAASGSPALVRYGAIQMGFSTPSGTLVYQTLKPGGFGRLALASIDADGQVRNVRRLDLRSGNMMGPFASFSPDGSRIYYTAADEDPALGTSLVSHDLATGQERVLYRTTTMLTCHSAASHPSVFCVDYKGGGRTEVFSVTAESGAVTQLGVFREPPGTGMFIREPSRDDTAIYFTRMDFTYYHEINGPLVRWDIATGQETVLAVPSSEDEFLYPSQDERWLERIVGGSMTTHSIRPMSGGAWKPAASPVGGWAITTPDGNYVLYSEAGTAGRISLNRVPVAGGQPEHVGDLPDYCGAARISNDGRQLLCASASTNSYDLWVLDHFVPADK